MRSTHYMKKINWDYIHHCIKERTGYSLSKYSQVKLGRSESYLSQCKCGRLNISNNALTYMIKDLGMDENALWQISESDTTKEAEFNHEMTAEEFAEAYALEPPEEEKPQEEQKNNVELLAPSWKPPIFGDAGINLLEEINTKLDMVLELEEKLNTLDATVEALAKKVNEPKESTLDMVIRLAQMLKGATA